MTLERLREIAVRIHQAGKLTQVKRIAALLLFASFYLPLYSCTYHPKERPHASTHTAVAPSQAQSAQAPTVHPVAQPPQHNFKIPTRVDYTAYESIRWPSIEGATTIAAFAWALLFQLAFIVLPDLGRQRATAILELLLCCASAGGLGWYLWHGLRMPGAALEYGSVIAYGALLAYFAATVREMSKPAPG